MRAFWLVIFVTACSGGSGSSAAPPLVPSAPPLPALPPIDPSVRGAGYLKTLASHIQPRWGQFLEDCRLRLAADHPLNIESLTADVELVIDERGMHTARVIQTSGNSDFDGAALEIVGEVPSVPGPSELQSDDGMVHVHWVFARDRRQAGPATAKVLSIEKPVVEAVQRLVERDLDRAARRIAIAPPGPERTAATEIVMTAALREALMASVGDTREAALDVIAQAKLVALAPDIKRLIDGQEVEQRVKAIRAAAALGDQTVVPSLVHALALELEDRPDVALAKIAALVALDHRDDAARAIASALDTPDRKRGVAAAVAALAILPDPKRAPALATWFAKGSAEVRQSVCQALPRAAPKQAMTLVGRGLRDPDASVRATCAEAAARMTKPDPRLVALASDRDEAVRVAAITALGAKRPRSALADRSPRVRAAAAVGSSDADLRALAKDPDPDVRAAAIAVIGDRAPELVLAAARDPAAQVRRAAVGGVTDDALLEKLATDVDPDVATAALVRYAARRGRDAITTELVTRLASATPKSLERVRIARSWLLAR